MTYICAEVGSTHNGYLSYAKELVDICANIGCDAVKFQLFDKDSEYAKVNIPVPYYWMYELKEYGIKKNYPITITASVFDKKALEVLLELGVPWVKFAYSQSDKWEWQAEVCNAGKKAFVSSDCMTRAKVLKNKSVVNLYCIPEYPITKLVSFEDVFDEYDYDGFSDHTLGYAQTIKAVQAGAEFIEKHITLPYNDVTCPDSFFALKPKKFEDMVKTIRGL